MKEPEERVTSFPFEYGLLGKHANKRSPSYGDRRNECHHDRDAGLRLEVR